MKKTLLMGLLLPILLLVAQSAVAQIDYIGGGLTKKKNPIRWGVMGGINFADFSLKGTKFELENKPGWQIGMMASIPLVRSLTLDPQVLYVRQTLDLSHSGNPKAGDLTCSSIDVPVALGFKAMGPIRLFVGPVFTLMNKSDGKYGGKSLDFSSMRTTLSYMLGAEVRLFDHLRLDIRYNGQFKNKDNVMIPEGEGGVGEVRSQCYLVNVGYYF